MLLDANLSYTFWTEAVTVANYLQNRLPTKGIETIPYEEWIGKKTKVTFSNIRLEISFMFQQAKQKLNNVAKSMIFVSYENSKVYRCYNSIERKLTISRDVHFTNTRMNNKKLDSEKVELCCR